jgi:hypothetical protein
VTTAVAATVIVVVALTGLSFADGQNGRCHKSGKTKKRDFPESLTARSAVIVAGITHLDILQKSGSHRYTTGAQTWIIGPSTPLVGGLGPLNQD